MTEIEKFLNEQFTQVITEDKTGIKCLFKHKEGLIDDGVVFFEFAKKKWSKKPIMSKRQFVIVDCDMSDVLTFLNQYLNINENDFPTIRHYIVNKSIYIQYGTKYNRLSETNENVWFSWSNETGKGSFI